MPSKKRKDPPLHDQNEVLYIKSISKPKKFRSNNENYPKPTYDSTFQKKVIKGDGNCLFRSILYSLTGDDSDHFKVRTQICDYIHKNIKKFSKHFQEEEKGLKKHLKSMRIEGIWGTDYELYAASELWCFNFEVYKPNNLEIFYQHSHSKQFPYIYLEFANGNHFNVLFKKGLITISKSQLSSLEDYSESIKKISAKEKDFDTIKNLKSVQKWFKEKNDYPIQESNNIKALYPFSKNNTDAYNEAFRYLSSKIIPFKISSSENYTKSLKNWSNYITKSYKLYKISPNLYSSSRLVLFSKKGEEMTIPFKKEIENIIFLNHTCYSNSSAKHYGVNITLQNIMKRQLYWATMASNVREFINNCPDCVEKNFEKPIKAPKMIIPTGPLERIQADLWELPKEMSKATINEYKYILTCEDHFSKYKWCFLLTNKLGTTIAQHLTIVFMTFGRPKIFQSDNGREFKNENVINLLETYGVQMINSSPRHPQSQGMVERHNYWLGVVLKSSFQKFKELRQNNEKWDINLNLMNFITAENNRVHTVTKEIPNTLILTKNKKLISQVQERMRKRYMPGITKHLKKAQQTLSEGSKVFIVKKVFPNKDHTNLDEGKANKLKKSERDKIPAIVVSNYGMKRGKVLIKIEASSDSKIKLHHGYHIHSNLLAPAIDQSWRIMVQKYNRL